jgi:ribosomal protein L11 methyltransferase
MAEIAEAGFDTFLETDKGFEAYAEEKKEDNKLLAEIKEKYRHVNPLIFFMDKVQKQNWNEEWEKNVEPVIVEDQCLIRAEFHKIKKEYPYEIIITPKMSFGTGHHQTTYLMIKAQLKLEQQGAYVMDAGCGTAILSVMASKRGAKKIEAFDIDEWSIENGRENVEMNGCQNVSIRKGTISDFTWPDKFDVILANINKNVLLNEMSLYAENLKSKGLLLLSGFYEKDIPDLVQSTKRLGLELRSQDHRESWASLLFQKSS